MRIQESICIALIFVSIFFLVCSTNGEEIGSKVSNAPTYKQREALKELSLEKLLSILRDYGFKSEPLGGWSDSVLEAIFTKGNWLEAVDPAIEVYTQSSNLSVKAAIVKVLSSLCTTREMPEQVIDKIQSLLISEIEKKEVVVSLRKALVRGLGHSVHKPFQSWKEKKALREKGINPDIPSYGKDRVVTVLTKLLNDENKLVRIETIGWLNTVEDVSALPALENRNAVEEDNDVKRMLDNVIQRLKIKTANKL